MSAPAPASAPPPHWLSRRWPVPAFVLLGGLYRLFLGSRYAGWEESDYGNLAMIEGVLQGRFLHYDMNHMPGYYGLGALVHAVVGDAVVAGRAVSLLGGLVALGFAVSLTDRLAGRRAAVLAGLLLCFQPEFALYASSSLREPVYAAFVLACLSALSRERLLWAGLAAAGAFLVRWDAALVLGATMGLAALGRSPRPRRLGLALGPLLLAFVAWSTYTRIDHGTFAFWSHAIAVNLETGLGAEATQPHEWLAHGLTVVLGLLGRLLPWRIGWGFWLGLWGALLLGPWGRHGPRRTALALALGLLGFWAAVGFTGQHDPVHNLYWKWMMPLVPVLLPIGAASVVAAGEALHRRLGPVAGLALVLVLTGQALGSYARETRRQVALSETLYRPQLQLGRWIEASVPDDLPLLVDNIPACWLNRRPHERSLTSWFDVPSAAGDPAAFGAWLRQSGVGWVLWFREDWTQAPVVAPFLAGGGSWTDGQTALTEVAREDAYGWILFRVEGRGEGAPPRPLSP